jgi:predicted nucleic acid-binding protein
MTIIDSCVVMDLADPTRPFHQWSSKEVSARLRSGRLFSPDIVFGEVSAGYSTAEETRALFTGLGIEVVSLTDQALFLAAKTYCVQKQARTPEDSLKRILPDYYVGAMAISEGLPLLTRDRARRWETRYPGIKLITP